MNCPKCGGQDLVTLESRKNEPYQGVSDDVDLFVIKACEQYGDEWPNGLATRLADANKVSVHVVTYRKQRYLQKVKESRFNPVFASATDLCRKISAPYIRRRRECKCGHRFTTYELRESDIDQLRTLGSNGSEHPLDGYTVMKAYTKAIRTLEQSMEQSLRSAKRVD